MGLVENGIIENGMISSTWHYTNYMPGTVLCDMCHQRVDEGDTTHFNSTGETVCVDCMGEYLRNNGGDFINDYISEHEKEYYLDWWFKSLTDEEKISVLKNAYKHEDKGEMAEDRVDFCKNDDKFYSFVKECLMF